jgi:hypothetical protein
MVSHGWTSWLRKDFNVRSRLAGRFLVTNATLRRISCIDCKSRSGGFPAAKSTVAGDLEIAAPYLQLASCLFLDHTVEFLGRVVSGTFH